MRIWCRASSETGDHRLREHFLPIRISVRVRREIRKENDDQHDEPQHDHILRESFNVFTEILFCIISSSIPVMVTVINIPAMICFRKNILLSGSVKKIWNNPLRPWPVLHRKGLGGDDVGYKLHKSACHPAYRSFGECLSKQRS